jgi:hypothetical protein
MKAFVMKAFFSNLTAPKWQIALKSSEYLLPSALLLILPVLTRNALVYGVSWEATLVISVLLLSIYMSMRCLIHKGALVSLPLNSPRLQWCLDVKGRLYPHLDHGLAKDVPNGVMTHGIKKQWFESAFDAIEEAGMFGRPIVVKTPFGLDSLCSRLEACGWRVERKSSATTPLLQRITLVLRRSSWRNPAPWRRSWRDVGVMNHAIFYPVQNAFDKQVLQD